MSIRAHYDHWSKIYDFNDNKTRDLDQKATIEVLNKYSFDSVIELGCGTGKNTQWLLKKANKIYGLDFSEKMLDLAKLKITSDKVKFIQCNILQDWPITEKNFDLITSSLTLEHIENLNDIFAKAYSYLRKSGLFFISELHPFKQYLGSKAKFEENNKTTELKTYIHNISDFLDSGDKAGFKLIELQEWFDEDDINLPRLITFVFQK
ncbi:MAG TPA: class I SAM-dependent methyltransferase [Bacteroidetes bacterium]|nr:class I SAM-dependent methyltransferase [Bacteroidota bacterium]